jgi:hypothetical protein
MIFDNKHDAEVYKKCQGRWFDKAHKVIPATIDGKPVGWMLHMKTKWERKGRSS